MAKPSTLMLDDALHTALQCEDDVTVEFLVSRLVGFKHMSRSGESCVYIATQLGREDYLRLLLPKVDPETIDAAKSAHQWTPLFIACVEGHVSTVKILLDAGADTTCLDYLGWTAKEHAAFRGHLPVAEMFPSIDAVPKLGVLPMRNDDHPKKALRYLPGTNTDGIILSISSSESPSLTERIMPLLDDPVDNTLVFAVKHPAEAAMLFKVHKSDAEQDDYGTIIGTGIAFLHAQSTCLGAGHGTLLREQSVPILCKDTLSLLGTLSFSFLIAKPYHQLQCPSPSLTCLNAPSSALLVGHRGLGQNSRERFLQLGENTIASFLAARKQGASFVEFDVQLTRDHVPVLFHDYSLSESGTDTPIHDVTLDQFMHVSNIQSARGNPLSIVGSSERSTDVHLRRPRSRSVETAHGKGAEEVKHRMKHTVDSLKKGFKPNTRGDFIHDTFATLEDALRNVPEDIGFDIEISRSSAPIVRLSTLTLSEYPRLHEALAANISPTSIELNIFVDTILNTLARFALGRKIFLSSFTPEICILLAIKQKAYPILFITNAGKRPISDREKRAGSLRVAVRFAKQWGLAGLVVAADCLVMCPRLIGYVKCWGLVCVSYGALNNEVGNVELQIKAGIDLIVADRVGLVSRTLESLHV